MIKRNHKPYYLILLISAAILILFAITAMLLYFVPSKQTVIKFQHVTVPQANPVKITSLDIDLTYYGDQDDFEDLLNNPENPNNDNFSIDDISFNEDSQDIDVPDSYLNTDDEDQALNNLLTQPHYVDELLQTKVWSFQSDVKIQIRNIALFVVT